MATIAVAATLFTLSPSALDNIELNWVDLRFRARGPIAPSPQVVIAAIDEKSLATEGRWPWARSKIAALVDVLSRDGAKVIGFDVLFSESEVDPRLALVNKIAREVNKLKIDNAQLRRVLRDSRVAADPDRILVGALARSSSAIVLGYFFHMNEKSVGYPLAKAAIARRFDAIAGSEYPLVYRVPHAPAPPFIKAYAPQGNLAAFTKAAASSGYFTVESDPDGVVRWMPLIVQGGGELYPPLSVLCVWQYLGKPQLAVRLGPYGVNGVQIGKRFIPTDESGRLFINYRGPPGTFPTYSISDILNGKVPKATFKDKIVLVGATATGIGDIRTTPLGPLFPGPEINANAVGNILAGDFIEKPRWSSVFDLCAIVALGLVLGLVLPRTSSLVGALFAGALFAAYVLGAYELFARARIVLNMVYPLFTVAATYTVLTLYRFLSEERERRRIKQAFQQYVAPDVIEIMLKDPAGVRLGGEERVLTALISDLEGYTSFSERRRPNEVIAVLSDYYGHMTEQVFAVQGTLVEYVGDELFALYGAPVAQADHAKRACESALAMQAQRAALNEEWPKVGRPRLKARTGINTGNMLVGNIGSKYRFHYGAMGDPVNLASRLEGLNKMYGTEIIVSGDTADLVDGAFRLRELDLVRVKGRGQALGIYELLGTEALRLPAAHEEMLAAYQAGLARYREQRWDEAIALFRKCLQLRPEDGPSRLMEGRCQAYRDTPPGERWDGVTGFATK